RITLETPNQWETWLKKARQKEAELKAVREARKAERKGQKPSEN
ncbi:MAG: ribosome biogenesis GTPase YlqF, partial [Neisseria sp.]